MQFCTKKKLITYIASAAGATTVSVIAYYFILAASGVGPEAPFPPSAPAHSSPQSGCVYLKGNSGAVDILGCGDGLVATPHQTVGRAAEGTNEHCALSTCRTCARPRSCGDGHHCCEQDCSDKGGNRSVPHAFSAAVVPARSAEPNVHRDLRLRRKRPRPRRHRRHRRLFRHRCHTTIPRGRRRRRSARRRSARRRSARRRHLKAQLLMTRRGTRRATPGLGPAEMKTINKFSKLRANLSKMPKPHRPIISGPSD